MKRSETPIRVLHSFPLKIGAGRICEIAWQQVAGVSAAGGDVTSFPGAIARPLPPAVAVRPTLARGRTRIPYRAIGIRRALRIHDRVVARRLPALAGEIDVVHAWPSGALETLKTAKGLGIPTVLERPSAHTRAVFEVVARESERLGVPMPADHEHAQNAATLAWEDEEFRLADRLLCPSDFVVDSFLQEGFAPEKLARHSYGFDEGRFHPRAGAEPHPFTLLFAGHAAPLKGLHYALEAWLRSPACADGRLLIAGPFLPAYDAKLAPMLAHPSVQRLGHRSDVDDLLRESDALVLPTISEGSPLVVMEALGSGCVPVVSEVCAGVCRHLDNALVHAVGDVDALTEHITLLHANRDLLERLKAAAFASSAGYTWRAAGERLLGAYRGLVRDRD